MNHFLKIGKEIFNVRTASQVRLNQQQDGRLCTTVVFTNGNEHHFYDEEAQTVETYFISIAQELPMPEAE